MTGISILQTQRFASKLQYVGRKFSDHGVPHS